LNAKRTTIWYRSLGMEAALGARWRCIAVTTSFNREKVHAQGRLEGHWIVDDPDLLPGLVRPIIRVGDRRYSGVR
jgi:hypothetical protein